MVEQIEGLSAELQLIAFVDGEVSHERGIHNHRPRTREDSLGRVAVLSRTVGSKRQCVEPGAQRLSASAKRGIRGDVRALVAGSGQGVVQTAGRDGQRIAASRLQDERKLPVTRDSMQPTRLEIRSVEDSGDISARLLLVREMSRNGNPP